MIYILICLSLSLAGITGLQFFYLAYLDRLDKDLKNRIRELETHWQYLANQLNQEESQREEKEVKEKNISSDLGEVDGDEIWADVLEEAWVIIHLRLGIGQPLRQLPHQKTHRRSDKISPIFFQIAIFWQFPSEHQFPCRGLAAPV